jgi:hypothetical protein
MVSISPFRVFNDWLFDGNIKSEIPKEKYDENGNLTGINILKYDSPVTNQYVIKLFINNLILNEYLNDNFNNMYLLNLPRETLFRFVKQCVIDFRIRKGNTVFYKRQLSNIIVEKLRKKFPLLKYCDLKFLADKILKSSEKDSIYAALGLEKEKIKKIKLPQQKNEKNKSLIDFINENFEIIQIE